MDEVKHSVMKDGGIASSNPRRRFGLGGRVKKAADEMKLNIKIKGFMTLE